MLSLAELEARSEALFKAQTMAPSPDHVGRDVPLRKSEHMVAMSADGIGETPDEVLMRKAASPQELAFQDFNDACVTVSAIMGKPVEHTKLWRGRQGVVMRKRAELLMTKAAMDTSTATAGSEWVPTYYSNRLVEQVDLELKLWPLFEQIPMPGPTYVFPTETARPTVYLGSEQTSDEGTKVTSTTDATSNFTLTSKKFNARIPFSDEAEEDYIVPAVPTLRRRLASALGRAKEEATISGDTSGSHQDADVAAGDRRKAFRGLRYHALNVAGSTQSLLTFNEANLLTMMALLGDLGANPDDLVWICGPKVFRKGFCGLTNVQTVDKYGPGATILRGELAKVFGVPVLVSPVSREDLNATGTYDGTTTNNGIVLLVYRPYWFAGNYKQPRIKIYDSVNYEQGHMVIRERVAFNTPFTSTKSVIGGIDAASA